MGFIYITGPVTGLTHEQLGNWRHYAKNQLQDLNYTCIMANLSKQEIGPSQIVACSRFHSTHCDVLLANFLDAEAFDTRTIMEMAWADSARIPIVMCVEEGTMHDTGMLTELATFVVHDLDDAIQAVTGII